jgi:hypothetical protein
MILITVALFSCHEKENRKQTKEERIKNQKTLLINHYQYLDLIESKNFKTKNNHLWFKYKNRRDSIFSVFKKNFPDRFIELESDFLNYKPVSKIDSSLMIQLRLNLIDYEKKSGKYLDSLFYNWKKNESELKYKLDSLNTILKPLAFKHGGFL